MNGAGQQQFSQMMQLLNYKERLKADTRAEEAAGRAERREGRMEQTQRLSYLRADKEYQGLGKTFGTMLGQDTAIDNYSRTAVRMGEQLVQLANQKSKSGLPVWQAFTNAKGAITGDPLVDKFRMQLMGFRNEVSRVIGGSPMSTAMTEGVRREGEGFLRDSATAKQVQGILDQFKIDVGIRKQESKKTLDGLRRQMRARESQYGIAAGEVPEPEAEEQPEPTSSGAGAPAAAAPNDPAGIR